MKLIDFGLSKYFYENRDESANLIESITDINLNKRQNRTRLLTKVGTPSYISPEVLTGNYDEKCDVWSAGVILYMLLSGYPPFQGSNSQQILEEVKKGKLSFLLIDWSEISQTTISLIRRLITDNKSRLCASDVATHEWLASFYKKEIPSYKLKNYSAT